MLLGMKMCRRHSATAGLSLVEMAVFLMVLGFLIVAGSRLYTVNANYAREQETAMKLQKIKEAITAYASQYKRLPCPASRTAPIDSASFGYEFNLPSYMPTYNSAARSGSASDQCPYEDMDSPPPMTTNDTERVVMHDPNAGDPSVEYLYNVRLGAVPTRSLGLPDDMMFDGWGNRLVYAVYEYYVYEGGYDLEDAPEAFYSNFFYGRKAGMTIVNMDGDVIEDASVQWLVLSPGADGRGAYNRNGQLPEVCPMGIIKADENCDDDAVFMTNLRKNYSNTENKFTSTLIYGLY